MLDLVIRVQLTTNRGRKKPSYDRLPAQLLGWNVFCKEMVDKGKYMFSSEVEFGYLVPENRFYANIL